MVLVGGVIIKEGLHHRNGWLILHGAEQQGMLKVRVSDLKSAGWDLLKLERVKKNTPDALLSYTNRWQQESCDCQPPPNGGWEGMSIIDSSFWELSLNLVKTHKMVEGMLKITENGA